MGKASADEMCLNSSSIENKEIVFLQEALSLSDLPNNEEKQTTRESPRCNNVTQEDFAFCSFDGSLLNILDMCTADEVFFQGQILPLSHSTGMPTDSHNNGFKDGAMCNERSTIESSPSENYALQMRTESMEHCHSSVGIKKSSVNSTITNTTTSSLYKPRIRNQFHSQQSPTPQVRFSKIKHRNINSSNRKSNMWSLFRVGLVTISPEIALQDLKNRCNKDFRSQSSTSSGSSSSNSSSNNENKMRIILSKKKRQRFLQKNRTFLRSCKCSVKAVEIADSNVVTMNRDNDLEDNKDIREMKETKMKQGTARKQTMSRYEKFDEWLKQLSLENSADET